ncbi:glycogen debranching protein GlgX [Eleftheria terrae]|uniref:glycogen debranching protein GlgX n=1 Tax=Eleftheria terrae TaxID=1597781 RepID=UPI00263B2907|nr:glycogen debranching protein GlgX [Eleftheria terrae]WKB53312.1 glycogen debranching protein GlgX [Eleftheria terrae]
MSKPRTRTGRPYPLGATWDGRGVNFAFHSSVAERVELCLFERDGQREARRIELEHHRHNVWYGYVAGCRPGDLYGLRVHGPYAPEHGLRCNPHKLLLDPYAKAIVGELRWTTAHYGFQLDADGAATELPDARDNADFLPKCQVVDDSFDWEGDTQLRTPWADTLIYEVHVKGYTALHPDVPPALRGSYAGLGSEPAIAHLRRLGVTAVELLPVHAFFDDERLVKLGLRNYWGYNTVGYFAPEARYSASGAAVTEFKQMVKALHAAGIEVILDVVYNHTAEGNELGPTFSFKGIDNPAYYRLDPKDRRHYVDYTGCGNTMNTRHPVVVRMIMDSLRYWVQEMHVDGFRFDLASALGRGQADFDLHSGFFTAIAQDPLLSHVKLIAEPWDLGEGGYQVGGFPPGWAEWNGRYRDTVRDFWRPREGNLAELSKRLCGSSDIYQHARRCPTDSINLVTVHDGFTLHDLVSYNEKHNLANGEDNRDGDNHNRSWNCGAEGETDDELVNALRERQKRNLLLTLLLSQGTPLLLGGDEMGRTQRGNNNGYCQDNDISWLPWPQDERSRRLCDFVQRLVAFRKAQPALRRSSFFSGKADADGHKDITWLTPAGTEMASADWVQPGLGAVAALICGWKTDQHDEHGEPLTGDSVLILLNAQDDPVAFALPEHHGAAWLPRFDTRTPVGLPAFEGIATEGQYVVAGRSIAVLTQPSI